MGKGLGEGVGPTIIVCTFWHDGRDRKVIEEGENEINRKMKLH